MHTNTQYLPLWSVRVGNGEVGRVVYTDGDGSEVVVFVGFALVVPAVGHNEQVSVAGDGLAETEGIVLGIAGTGSENGIV